MAPKKPLVKAVAQAYIQQHAEEVEAAQVRLAVRLLCVFGVGVWCGCWCLLLVCGGREGRRPTFSSTQRRWRPHR